VLVGCIYKCCWKGLIENAYRHISGNIQMFFQLFFCGAEEECGAWVSREVSYLETW